MTQPQESSPWADALRLSIGTLTAIPIGPPRRVDRQVAGLALLLAPVVGVALGGVAATILWGAGRIYHDPLLPASLAVAALAMLTRGLHLDGLADTADGLGVGAHRGRERALAVMRGGDVGPFGVAAIVLVVLVQLAAVADTTAQGVGVETLIVATVVGRLCAMVACVRGVPAARDDGLGATVAGSVPRMAAVAVTAVVIAAAVILGAVAGNSAGARAAVTFGLSVAASLTVTMALIALARKRFGGITGDVLGAIVELAFVAALLVLATYHR